MTRYYYKIIYSCWECPSLTSDMNLSRWECSESDRTVCYQGSSKEKINYIPSWCILSKEDK
jgi:hypothetical protein